MSAIELLNSLKDRGFLVRANGQRLEVTPFVKLTTADHRALKVHTPALLRLLSEKTPEPSAADADTFVEHMRKKFEARVIRIDRPEPRTHNGRDLGNDKPLSDPLSGKDHLAAASAAPATEVKPMRSSANQFSLPTHVPPSGRRCQSCDVSSFDPARVYCDCGAVLPPARVGETSPAAAISRNKSVAPAPPAPAPSSPPASVPPQIATPGGESPPISSTETPRKSEPPANPESAPSVAPPREGQALADNDDADDGDDDDGDGEKPRPETGGQPAASRAESQATSAPEPPSDLAGLRQHIRARRAALAGFMEQGADLWFENGTLTVFPRHEIYIRYLADNRRVIGDLATEFFNCAVTVELGAVPEKKTGD